MYNTYIYIYTYHFKTCGNVPSFHCRGLDALAFVGDCSVLYIGQSPGFRRCNELAQGGSC